MHPTDAAIAEYERRWAQRSCRRQQKVLGIIKTLKYLLCLGAVSLVGLVLDVVLASSYTADGRTGAAISGSDMISVVPLAGTAAFVFVVLGVWVILHLPGVQRHRALRQAARIRRAANIGPEHPIRQFSALHPYLAFFLRTMVIFEVLQLVFGRVTPRRR